VSLGIIELNDSGIQVAVDGELVAHSPGYAVLDGDRLLIGEEGVDFSRLLPRWTNNRFWNQLSTEPIANATGAIRHHADLAFAHLESLWLPISKDVDQVIFLVPGYYNREQLGLLLGIAKECGMPTAGVVDTSVATAATQALRDVVLHLDIHLHRITLTRLTNATNLSRSDHTTVTETGIFTLWDRWANIVANQFIQTSRYDPLHEASSEQALYSQLPDWITALGGGASATFNLNLADVNHEVSVSSEQLMAACTPIYPQVIQAIRNQVPAGQNATLLLSHRYQGFPGLTDSLNLIPNVDVVDLSANVAIEGAAGHADKIIGTGSVSHVINLPVTTRRVVDDIEKPRHASHLFFDNHAVAIGQSYKLSGDLSKGIRQDLANPACTIFRRGNEILVDVRGGEIMLNDEPITETTPVGIGDVLNVGGQSLTLISVS
jgi:hypothetical protein